jgi:hypothetical protein
MTACIGAVAYTSHNTQARAEVSTWTEERDWRKSAFCYYHHDAIGSVVALTNNSSDLTGTYGYTAFGEVRDRTGTSIQPYQYLGNSYDSTTKLLDFHARVLLPRRDGVTATRRLGPGPRAVRRRR